MSGRLLRMSSPGTPMVGMPSVSLLTSHPSKTVDFRVTWSVTPCAHQWSGMLKGRQGGKSEGHG